MFLSSDVWGPHYWFVLETMAMSYPEFPNDSIKKKYFDFIRNLPLFLPNERMGKEFEKMLNEFPVSPYLSSRLSFQKWVHYMHNKINKKVGKPQINFYHGLERYYKRYEAKKTKRIRKMKKDNKYIIAGAVIILLGVIFFIYKK